ARSRVSGDDLVVDSGSRKPAGAPDLLPLAERIRQRRFHHGARNRVPPHLEDRADGALDAKPGVLPGAVGRFFLTGGVSFRSGVVAPAVLTANRRLRRPHSFTRRLTLPLAVLLVWMARRRSGALPRGHAVGDRAFFRNVRIIGKN